MIAELGSAGLVFGDLCVRDQVLAGFVCGARDGHQAAVFDHSIDHAPADIEPPRRFLDGEQLWFLHA